MSNREALLRIDRAKKTGSTILNLSGFELTSVPAQLGDLANLTTLLLHNNQLTSVPAQLGDLVNLTFLRLDDNQLTSVPAQLGDLANLTTLFLNNNQLTSVPAQLGDLVNLTFLRLNNNQLTSVPAQLGDLANLTTLFLHNNQLTSVPAQLGDLANLTELFLNNNQLTSVPAQLGDLVNLTFLRLDDNQLTSVPAQLGGLANLNQLYLNNNKLMSVPAQLGDLANLTTLFLSNNPLNPDLDAARREGTASLLRFLREQAADQVSISEAKLILVGEGGVGKTSLLAALRGDPWIEDHETTHGVEIKPLHLAYPEGEEDLILNGWDFGGQPIYRSTHQLFFSAPAVYLVAWEPRRGPEGCFVEYWLKLIKHRAFDEEAHDRKPRILVVATHGGPKERRAHIDEHHLRKQFGELLTGFHHIDSKPPGVGLEALKDAIAQAVCQIPHAVGRKVPSSWKRLLDALKSRSQRAPYITYSEYLKTCAAVSVSPDSAALYATMFHELGHAIHYHDDDSLKDIVVLKADWLSKAISFVLEDQLVVDHNGLVHHTHLSHLWQDPAREAHEQYAPEVHGLLLRLMERFDLTYRVELPGVDTAQKSLVAQLVPGDRPDLAPHWTQSPDESDIEEVRLCRIVDAQTKRPARAEGLIYRLIVRLHRYSLGRTNHLESRHWQRGLLINDGYNGTALIEQLEDDDIRITVRAAYPANLLHTVSREVKWLIDTFWKGLDCEIAVPCPAENCSGASGVETLIKSRTQGRTEYPCRVCDTWSDINALLSKPQPMPDQAKALQQLQHGQEDIKRGLSGMNQQLRRLASQIDARFDGMMTALVDEARDGPRLFSITPVDPGFWDKPNWISQKVRITLWCEHSRLPVPLLTFQQKRQSDPNHQLQDETQGVYEVDMPRKWLVAAAPYARFAAGLLGLALPLASVATEFALDDAAYKHISEELALATASATSLLEATQKAGDWMAEGERGAFEDHALTKPDKKDARRLFGGPSRFEGGHLRQIQVLVQREDAGLGNLRRVQNRRREFLWVHPQYIKVYNPDLPKMTPPSSPSVKARGDGQDKG